MQEAGEQGTGSRVSDPPPVSPFPPPSPPPTKHTKTETGKSFPNDSAFIYFLVTFFDYPRLPESTASRIYSIPMHIYSINSSAFILPTIILILS